MNKEDYIEFGIKAIVVAFITILIFLILKNFN